jgi:O-antigen/teichoic acid export membrane protein|tara:strand:+ start:188740 stop:189999 length:1260 start_codon:yes stop_codon:yes gene_type:complete
MIQKIFSSKFISNAFVMVGGVAIAQLITIALSPIITRLYSPEDLGLLAFYVALVSILAVVATGQYQHAIMLQKKVSAARHLTYVCLMLSAAFTLICLLFVVVFYDVINMALEEKALHKLLILVPLGVGAASVLATLNMWFTWTKNFKSISSTHIAASAVNNGTSIGLGTAISLGQGVIWGHFIGQCCAAFYFLLRFMRAGQHDINHLKIRALAKRYKKFPTITLPHSLFSTLSIHLPSLILIGAFSPAIAGLYFLANRVANVPITILSQSLYPLLFGAFNESKNRAALYRKKFFYVNVIFLPLFVAFWCVAPALFAFVFGAEWGRSGVYVQLILPMLYCKFISNLFTTPIYFIYERQFENFIFSALITLTIALSLLYGAWLDDIVTGLVYMALSNVFFILIKLSRAYGFVRLEKNTAAL